MEIKYKEKLEEAAEQYEKQLRHSDSLYDDDGYMYSSVPGDSFIAGAKWDNKLMVERALDWLNKNSYKYRDEVTDSFRDRDMINDFKKAMEE